MGDIFVAGVGLWWRTGKLNISHCIYMYAILAPMSEQPFGTIDNHPCGCLYSAMNLWQQDGCRGRIINVTFPKHNDVGVQNFYIPPRNPQQDEDDYLNSVALNGREAGYSAPPFTIGYILELLETGAAREISAWEAKGI